MKKISDQEKMLMARPITQQEVRDTLWAMKKEKAPGNDGLPAEFYKFFWEDIGKLVTYVIQEAAESGFSINQRRGIISLLEKPGKDMKKIENWRPLSLLNVDYKILSKILATRMEKVLPQLINWDQTGFMKNRSMYQNLFDLLNAVHYCELKKMEKLLISFDFEKAF